jgi:hypothetical protein
MMVDRSTCCAAAASAIVISWRTSCSQISYFCDGLKNRFARLFPGPVPPLDSDMR